MIICFKGVGVVQNNKVLKRIRYALKYRDKKIKKIFALGGLDLSLDEINGLLVNESDPTYKNCSNKHLHCFLNGLIFFNRSSEGETPSEPPFIKISKHNANNLVIKKLKIAFKFSQEEIIHIFNLGELPVTTTEVNGIFRGEKSKMYRECGDKYIRKFLKGLAILLRSKAKAEELL